VNAKIIMNSSRKYELMNFRQFFITNQWWGKLIGAFLGYLLGGSAGLLVGILLGNFIDRSLFGYYNRPHWSYHAEKREAVQNVFFAATFSVMGYIAKADGRVSEEEILAATSLMDEMRLNRKQREKAQRFFYAGKDPNFDLASMLSSLQQSCQDNPDLLKLFMDIQYRLAQADGLSEKKIQALDTIFSQLGFAPLHQQHRFYEDFGSYESQYSSAKASSSQESTNRSHSYQPGYQSPQDPLAYAYAILELKPNANKEEVKNAYRRLISRNHPDKLIAQGLPEEMIKMATDKTQKIAKAYELICRRKGW
jgi:DnaJ like chaperone protein